MYLAHLLPSKFNFCIGILAVAIPTGGIVSVDFDHLIGNPRTYKGKHVSVTGVAQVDGTSFTLFQPPHRELSRTIFVGQKVGKPHYNHLDNHWVKITGIVDTDERNIFACKVFLENVDALPRPPVPSIRVFCVVLNEGPATVRVELVNKAGNESTDMTLSPGEIHKTAVVEGQAKVYTPSESLFTGKLLSSCVVPSEKLAPEFFDSSTRTFYFRIRNGKIALVRPQEATTLKKRWQELEKQQ